MELTEIATVVSPGVGLLGVGLAVWALVYSKQSRDLADEGREDSAKAVGLAEKSNEIAIEAKDVAEEANTISLRAEKRDTERHDVDWDLNRGAPGKYVLINTGTDEAHNVRVRVVVDEWVGTETSRIIPGGKSVTVEIPAAVQKYQSERSEIARERQRAVEQERAMTARGFSAGMAVPNYDSMMSMQFQLHSVSYRVDWETSLGRHMDKSDAYTDSLGPHN